MKSWLKFKLKLPSRKITTALLIAVIAFVGFFIYKATRPKPVLKSAQVQRGTLQESLILSGEIKAKEQATVSFLTSGKIRSVNVKKGDVVKKGQILATIDQREIQKNLQKDLNDFSKTRLDLDQERDNVKDKAVTDAMKRLLDKAQYDVNNSVLDVEIQNLAYELSRVSSPVSGIILSTSDLYPGMLATPTGGKFIIVNPDTLYFEITADQTEVTQLHEQMSGELTLDSFLEEPIQGMIDYISFSPQEDESGTVYGIEFIFTNKSPLSQNYRLGMTGDVEFITREKKNTLYIPIAFLKEKNSHRYVNMMKDGKLFEQTVKTGIESEENVEIISGLQEKDIIYD